LVALANFMRLSLMKAAHVDLSDVAKQEFGYALSKITSKKEHSHRDPSTALRSGRDDKGRGALPGEKVAEQKPLFITLGGPKAHLHFGRDDKFAWQLTSFSNKFVIPTEAQRSGGTCFSPTHPVN
jgi:hypothetical protein